MQSAGHVTIPHGEYYAIIGDIYAYMKTWTEVTERLGY